MLAPATTAGRAATPAVDVPVGEPVRVQVPSVALDAAVGASAVNGGVFDPPNLQDAWWASIRGTPGTHADDTVYLAGHSLDDGRGVFYPLQSVEVGQEVFVTTVSGRLRYVVEATALYEKGGITAADEVWVPTPGRLVLVTCFVRDGQTTSKNFVVFASLAG